jgi:hypothetical protein
VSCASNQIALPSATRGRASAIASANDVDERASMMPSTVRATTSFSRTDAAFPQITRVTAATGTVWALTASRVRMSCARAEDPGRATMMA